MVEPPGPDEVRALVDEVLSGVVVGDFADTLFRAAAFARVAAAGRVHDEPVRAAAGSSYATDVSASRLITLADQLERAARLELDRLARLKRGDTHHADVLLSSARLRLYSWPRVGPRQPRVPQLAASSGHAP